MLEDHSSLVVRDCLFNIFTGHNIIVSWSWRCFTSLENTACSWFETIESKSLSKRNTCCQPLWNRLWPMEIDIMPITLLCIERNITPMHTRCQSSCNATIMVYCQVFNNLFHHLTASTFLSLPWWYRTRNVAILTLLIKLNCVNVA